MSVVVDANWALLLLSLRADWSGLTAVRAFIISSQPGVRSVRHSKIFGSPGGLPISKLGVRVENLHEPNDPTRTK